VILNKKQDYKGEKMQVEQVRDGKFNYFILSDEPGLVEIINKTYLVDLTLENCENLKRYCTKLHYSQNIPVDYNKVILEAVDEYLKKRITGKDLKEFEKMQAEEKQAKEKTREKELPKFDWDLANKK
jgi:hypothetical protein